MPLLERAAPPARVLIVDDSPEDRATFKRFLSREDTAEYLFSEAENLAEARQRAAMDEPQCVLMDFNLPDGTGLTLLHELMSSHGRNAFGVVMLTGSGDTPVAVEALKSGAHDYVEKRGLTALRLRQTVANAIAQASLHRRIEAQNLVLAQKNELLARQLARSQQEVVERTRAQTALSQSEAFLQSVIGANSDCVKVLDLDGRLLWMNEPGKTMFEIETFAEVANVAWASFWRQNGQEEEAAAAVREAAAGRVARFAGFCPTRKGQPKWWDVVLTPIFGPDARPEKLLCVSRDVTTARAAETAIRQKEAQLRLITDHIPVNLGQFDRDCRYRFANRVFAGRFGLEPEALVGKHIADIVGPELYAQARPYIDRALAGERVDFEIASPRAAGDRWMSVTYLPERDASGEVIGFIAASTDITDRYRAEKDVVQARDQAIKAAQARDNFLAALSHELRTPLNPVLLIASEAAENPDLPAHVRDDFAAIRNNVELEARLIDDLLDLSRITHGKLLLEFRVLPLGDVLRDALTNVQSDFAAKAIRLSVSPPPADLRVLADPVRLQQVFWNVLKNAVKFTPKGGTVEVTTIVANSGQRVAIAVRDSGQGIAGEDLARIFDAFSQGQHGGGHRFGGLGLGLAISQRLAERHGGHIVATSPGPDLGATFTIDLPVHTAPAESATAHIPVQENSARSPGRTTRLLVVEDHAATRESLVRLLARRGFAVTAAATATEACEHVRRESFALVISDIGLPDSDGYSLLGALRRHQPKLAGIALSGYGAEEDINRSRAAGFDDHLTKPVKMSALDQALARVLASAVRT